MSINRGEQDIYPKKDCLYAVWPCLSELPRRTEGCIFIRHEKVALILHNRSACIYGTHLPLGYSYKDEVMENLKDKGTVTLLHGVEAASLKR